MRLTVYLLLTLCCVSTLAQPQGTPRLDSHHLLLDACADSASSSPYIFADFRQAAAHLGDSCTLYIAPGVYWVDDPDTPEVVTGENGREPFGIVIRARCLRLIGLGQRPADVVLASQRGQTQGAVGNFTMFDFWCDSLAVENLTMGNYCNVDLDYPLNPALSRRKRSDAITQAHVGYVHGHSLTARRARFISRLNLNPLNGARHSYYEDCHFECTDDAMNGTAVYRRCDIDLYGQKPFWSTFGSGAMFIDCDFRVRSDNREMYFCKQGGPLTLIDCRYHAPTDSIYIAWTAYPQPWLRCYQQNFTLNGRPYVIGHRHPENTVILAPSPTYPPAAEEGREVFLAASPTYPPAAEEVRGGHPQPPHLAISRHEAELLTGADTLLLSSPAPHWRIPPAFARFVTLRPVNGDSVAVIPTNSTDTPADFCIEAYTDDGRVAACHLVVKPPLLPPPPFLSLPRITISGAMARIDYQLGLRHLRDESLITWLRNGIPVSTTHGSPQRCYPLTAADAGARLSATITPKHQRSTYGEAVSTAGTLIPARMVTTPESIDTDFADFPCDWQPAIIPGYWTVDGHKPADTAEYPWSFDRSKPMWEYGEGFNGAVGHGLLQAQRGARLMYTPVRRACGDMSLTLQVDPTKTAGQGFGSATGQYMDVCLKFDPLTLTGYGLRIIRTTKHAKAVDFLLVEYDHGRVTPLTAPVSSTCYRTGCTISLRAGGQRLTAHVETATPRPSGSLLPHVVDLSAPVKASAFGGVAIQHTGTCGESTTMLHRLQVRW